MSNSSTHHSYEPYETIVLPDNVYHSYQGEYFFGQTQSLHFGNGYYAWGGLINPKKSQVNMFLNAYTITNFSPFPITAQGWLSSNLPGRATTSKNYAAGNQSLQPIRQPKVILQNASYLTETPEGGTYTFVRRVEPSQTLTKHDFQGMYIIPAGSSFALFFFYEGKDEIDVKIAFGWWEEKNKYVSG